MTAPYDSARKNGLRFGAVSIFQILSILQFLFGVLNLVVVLVEPRVALLIVPGALSIVSGIGLFFHWKWAAALCVLLWGGMAVFLITIWIELPSGTGSGLPILMLCAIPVLMAVVVVLRWSQLNIRRGKQET
jgi:hypothetical protein